MTKDITKYDFPTLAPGTISFCTPEGGPMIVIDRDRFLVRGVEVQQGEGEAQQVYEAFVGWLRDTGLRRMP